MNIKELKAVAYATYLSAGGYKVLRNPKGTPSTVVRAIRYSHSIDPETLDKSETYKRITRDFAQPEKTKNKSQSSFISTLFHNLKLSCN